MPPWYRFMGQGFNEIPLGLCCLSSSLKQDGHTVGILNCDISARFAAGPEKIFTLYGRYKKEFERFGDPIWGWIRNEIESFAPDYLGINAKTATVKSALKVADIAKSVDPKICVVAGGSHATLMPERMAAMPNIDYVVRGEGERTLSALIAARERKALPGIPGLVYSDNGAVIDGGPRELIRDIDALPFPDRESLLHREQYGRYGFGIIITSRGCPFQCSYCAAKKMWPGPVRYRSPRHVIEEIKHVKSAFGTRYFNFRDDTFTLRKERVLEICGRIREEKLGIVWRCDTRADTLDEEVVRTMRESGCVQASVGIESGSDRILKLVKKGETTRDIERGIRLLRKYSIPVSAFIMVGFPGETKDEALSTLRFAEALDVDTLVLSVVTPYPGTEIYELFRQHGIVKDVEDYSDFYHHSPMMGLTGLEGDEYREFLSQYYAQVREYNRAFRRLFRRFIFIFKSSPMGAMERVMDYVRG